MRGEDNKQEGMFSYVSPEKRVPADHPQRPIQKMVDEVLKEIDLAYLMDKTVFVITCRATGGL